MVELKRPAWAKSYPNAWLQYLLREEEILKPAREKLAALKDNRKPKAPDLNWKGEEKTIFDKTLIKIPVSDRIYISQWEEDKDYHVKNKRMVPHMYRRSVWQPFLQHIAFRVLPLALICFLAL